MQNDQFNFAVSNVFLMKNLLNVFTKKTLNADHADMAITAFIIVMIAGFSMLIVLMLSVMSQFK